MRLGLNILATFLHSLKPRKLLSSSRNTYLPNIFARHNPRLAARAARLRATKSASRIRTSAAPSFTSSADGTAPRNGAHQHRRRTRCNRSTRSLKRSTAAAIILPAQVPSYPQPPGAYTSAPPGGSSISTTTDDVHTSTTSTSTAIEHGADPARLVAQKAFFEALYKQRAVLLRASDERREAAEAEARRVRAEEDAEYLRLLAEDRRKAQEEQRRAEEEAAQETRRVEAQERRRRREERRRRNAAREERRERARREEERRERERLEEERREWERLEQVRRLREQEARRQKAAVEVAARVAEWHRYYEEKWAVLRADVKVSSLAFSDIPWPVFGIPRSAEDITVVRVQEFLFHPQRESVQSAGQAKSLRSEMLRWHPDKFDAKVLNNVMEGDREAVKEAAGEVARILTQLTMEMQR